MAHTRGVASSTLALSIRNSPFITALFRMTPGFFGRIMQWPAISSVAFDKIDERKYILGSSGF